MKTNKLLGIFFIVWLSFNAVSVMAQRDEAVSPRQDNDQSPLKKDNLNSATVDRVRRLMAMGQYEMASALAENELNRSSDDLILKSLLAQCYKKGKNYGKLVALMRLRIQSEPVNFMLMHNAGDAHLLIGDLDSARYYFFESATMALDRLPVLVSIAQNYQRLGYYDYVVEFIDSVRILKNNSVLLASFMGDALTANGDFDLATYEYLTHMEKDSVAAAEAEAKLVSMIRYPESADTVMAILSRQIQSHYENFRLVNAYGQLLMDQGRFDEAREFYVEIDSLRNKGGNDILYFMKRCNKSGEYKQTILAGEVLTVFYDISPIIGNAQFLMAESYTATGEYDKALEIYHSIEEKFVWVSHKAEARLRIGVMYKDYLDDLDQARNFLDEVISTAPRSRYDIQARFELINLLIRENQLDSAMACCTLLLTFELNDSFKEKTDYIKALIQLFSNEYMSTRDSFRQILSRYPRGFYVNDAINYSLVLSEAIGSASGQIDLYCAAEYFDYINQEDSLEFYLNKICRIGIPALSPVSYLKLANLYVGQKLSADAVTAVDSLEAQYPESYFLPYGLKLKADIYFENPERRDESLEIYKNLLRDYSNYPFSAPIREILRRDAEDVGRI
ncbi:MAG: tetratricopeptide repeat protein [candidate division Zixibacteria bacterium]